MAREARTEAGPGTLRSKGIQRKVQQWATMCTPYMERLRT